MNNTPSLRSLFVVVACLAAAPAWAGKASIKVKDVDTDDQDTSITIHKGPGYPTPSPLPPEWEVITDEEEIEGDPGAGSQQSLANWKTACAEWKKEFKELNKENKILVLNCGKATTRLEANGQRVHNSMGKYKMKVMIHPGETRSVPAPTATPTATVTPSNPVTPTPAPTPTATAP
jgi:hypothetical protein